MKATRSQLGCDNATMAQSAGFHALSAITLVISLIIWTPAATGSKSAS